MKILAEQNITFKKQQEIILERPSNSLSFLRCGLFESFVERDTIRSLEKLKNFCISKGIDYEKTKETIKNHTIENLFDFSYYVDEFIENHKE